MTSAESNFSDLIRWLNRANVPYFIPWGYEHLPTQPSGGDVDLYVHPEAYPLMAEELLRRGYTVAKCPAYSQTHRHAQFACAGAYTIDLFSTFCFSYHGKIVFLRVETNILLDNRIFVNGMWIANPILEMLFTALRVLGGRSDPVKRLWKYLEES